MRARTRASWLWALALSWATLAGAEIREGARIVPQKIRDGLYVLHGGMGQGASVGVRVGEDGILLVDAMRAESNERLSKAIRKISEKPVRFVLNTHSDADHSGGNEFFARAGATILAQENFRYSSAFHQVRFRDKLSLPFDGEEVEAQAVLSHAPDDALIFLRGSNVLFMGDAFTTNWHPTFYTGGVSGQFQAIDLALSLADEGTVVVPGHGPVTDRQGLLTYRKNTGDWLERVGELHRLGRSVDEMFRDEALQEIKDRFNGEGREEFIPEARLKRFIQRTVSSELVAAYPLPEEALGRYPGRYFPEEGPALEVLLRDGKLFAAREGSFFVQLVPLSATRFHLRGWIDAHILFQLDRAGSPVTLTASIGDSIYEARRTDLP